MYRSSSYASFGGSGGGSGAGSSMARTSSLTSMGVDHADLQHNQHLPSYDPHSEVVKKEAARERVAQGMVHLIPAVVVLCALLLWTFSSPTIHA